MSKSRLVLALVPLAALAACTVNPRPVVVTTPAPVVQAAPAPAPTVVMGAAPGSTLIEVPAGYFPAPGSCRIWIPGVAAAQQEAPGGCADLFNRLPAGAVFIRG